MVLGLVDASSKADFVAVAEAVDLFASRFPAPVPGLPWMGRTGAASGLRTWAWKKLFAAPPWAGGASARAALAVTGAAVLHERVRRRRRNVGRRFRGLGFGLGFLRRLDAGDLVNRRGHEARPVSQIHQAAQRHHVDQDRDDQA
jgi:hypothetical protein